MAKSSRRGGLDKIEFLKPSEEPTSTEPTVTGSPSPPVTGAARHQKGAASSKARAAAAPDEAAPAAAEPEVALAVTANAEKGPVAGATTHLNFYRFLALAAGIIKTRPPDGTTSTSETK